MRTAQLSDRPIYIPKGRRELIQGPSTPIVFAKTASTKRPMTDQITMQNKAARHVQQDNQTTLGVEASALTSFTKSAPPKLASAGIYIPKAKREQMEKDAAAKAAEAATKDAAKAVAAVTKPATKVDCPTNAHTSYRQTQDSSVVDTVKSAPPQSRILLTTTEKGTGIVTDSPQTGKTVNVPSSSAAKTSSKPKEVVRGAVYVPKGRRELNEKKAIELPAPPAETTQSQEDANKSMPLSAPQIAFSGLSAGVSLPPQKIKAQSDRISSPPRSKTYSSWDDSSDEETSSNSNNTNSSKTPAPTSVSLEDTILQCTLVLSGVPSDMSDLARNNITRAYADKGATIKWTSTNECLLMFKTERAAMQMMSGNNASIFRVIRLQDVPASQREEFIAAARENFVVSKPERDSTVANRLIGAALGIRLPKNLTSASAAAKRAPSPVREDAWDD